MAARRSYLFDELGNAGGRFLPRDVVREFEQRHDSGMPFGRRLAVRDRIAPDPQLALECAGQDVNEHDVRPVVPVRVRMTCRKRTRDAHRPPDLGAAEEPLAADMERDAGPPERVLERG